MMPSTAAVNDIADVAPVIVGNPLSSGDKTVYAGSTVGPFYANFPETNEWMATTDSGLADVTEDCGSCGRATPHSVAVKILTESGKRENAEFSREPYRVSECRLCGETTTTRMNNA
jgi:hypothetical protein